MWNTFLFVTSETNLQSSLTVCCCVYLSLDSSNFSCQPSLSHNENLWCRDRPPFWRCNANIPSDLAEAKLNSSNDYCSSTVLFWCAHKSEYLAMQEEHSSFRTGLLFPAYSIAVAYRGWSRRKEGTPQWTTLTRLLYCTHSCFWNSTEQIREFSKHMPQLYLSADFCKDGDGIGQ